MNDITRIDTGIQNSDVKYTIQWAEMIRKSLALSPMFSFFTTYDKQIRDGQIVLPKAGANENLAALRSAVDYNTWSNVQDEVIIPFNTGFSTEAILLTPSEYLQYSSNSGVPYPLTEQSLSVKADKVAKKLARIMAGLVFEGQTEDGQQCGDGAIPQQEWTWNTVVGVSSRQDVANEFEKFVFGKFDIEMEKIRRIGLSDLSGKNATDDYRTGVDTAGSQYRIFTDFDFRRRWEIWKATYNYETGVIENGAYGSILGYQLFQDPFLPYVGITTTGMTAKSLYGNSNTVSIVEGTKHVGFVAMKSSNIVRGQIYNEMWEERIPRQKSDHLVGWNMKFGAGTYNVDEMFCINFTYTAVIDISSLNSITAPSSISATTPSATTEAEVRVALDPQVLTAVKTVDNSLTANDFTYTITGQTFPLDLTSTKTVQIKITGINQAGGTTGNIAVVLPVATTFSTKKGN